MAAGVYNFKVEQGALFTFKVQYKDGTGNPIPLVAETIKGQIKSRPSSQKIMADMAFQFTNDDPTTGEFEVTIAADAFDDLEVTGTDYKDLELVVYDIKATIVDESKPVRILNGHISVSPQVTK